MGGSNITLSLSIVYSSGFAGLLSPPFNTYWILNLSNSHFANIVVSPTLPCGISVSLVIRFLSLYQPVKIAPVFVGDSNIILSLSIVYFMGFAESFIPPFNTYWILKVSNSHFANIVVSPTLPLGISVISVIRSLSLYHAIKFAPVFDGDLNIILLLSIVYFTGFAGLLSPPFKLYWISK